MTHIGRSPGGAIETSQTIKAVVAALWLVVILFAGWLWSNTNEARADMNREIAKVRAEQQIDKERIATLEEATRNIRESLSRIEDGVNNLNRERRR